MITAPRCCRLAAIDAEGKVVDSGTGFYVSIDGTRLIATAHHVLSDLPGKGSTVVLAFAEPSHAKSEEPREAVQYPADFGLRPRVRAAEHLDFAVLAPPKALLDRPDISWFDARIQQEAAHDLRRIMSEARDEGGRLAALILGFPKYARHEDFFSRRQWAGAMACWAYIERLTNPPALYGEVPEMILEIEEPFENDLPSDVGNIIRHSIRNITALRDAEASILGGYSGAPVIYSCANGTFVVGTMKLGGLGVAGYACAIPMDLAVTAITEDPEWGQFCAAL